MEKGKEGKKEYEGTKEFERTSRGGEGVAIFTFVSSVTCLKSRTYY